MRDQSEIQYWRIAEICNRLGSGITMERIPTELGRLFIRFHIVGMARKPEWNGAASVLALKSDDEVAATLRKIGVPLSD